MYARVEWTTRNGEAKRDLIERPVSVTSVLAMIERRGGRVSRFNRIPKVG